MRITLLTKSFIKGGSASGASNLASALEAAGAEVIRLDAYAAQKGRAIGLARVAERVFERLLFDAETHCARIAPPVFDLPAVYETYRPDVVQLCDVSGNVIRFSDLTRLPCPVVHRMSDFWPYHGPQHYATAPEGHGGLAQWLYRKTIFSGLPIPDMRIAPSQWLADLLARHAPDPTGIRVIRNAVITPHAVQRLQPPAGALRFGFISNTILDPRKGFDTLQPNLDALAEHGIDVSLHLHGQLPEAETPKFERVKITNHGPFQRHELPRVFQSFDILLCPSRLDNSPNVLCEALAHGCPVIAQGGTGMDSYLTEKTGALIDFQTQGVKVESFIAACEKIAAAYNSYSKAATTYATIVLSPQAIGSAYLQLYDELRTRRANTLTS